MINDRLALVQRRYSTFVYLIEKRQEEEWSEQNSKPPREASLPEKWQQNPGADQQGQFCVQSKNIQVVAPCKQADKCVCIIGRGDGEGRKKSVVLEIQNKQRQEQQSI